MIAQLVKKGNKIAEDWVKNQSEVTPRFLPRDFFLISPQSTVE